MIARNLWGILWRERLIKAHFFAKLLYFFQFYHINLIFWVVNGSFIGDKLVDLQERAGIFSISAMNANCEHSSNEKPSRPTIAIKTSSLIQAPI